MSFATLGSVFVCVLFVSGRPALAQDPSPKAAAPYEQRAADTARGFIAAFGAQDADKAASYLEDDAQFRMEVALNRNIETGRENARQQMHKLFDRLSHRTQGDTGPRVQGGNIQLVQTEAIGGSKEVLVITRRIDNVTINGRPLHLPVGSFFRVNGQTGKIEEWLDVPLIAFDRNPPPAAK
ncbi:MAG TPA: nuclear transport factor 2 family protein [Vicinamibacterales bacterium]|nr:nuclear transport factor 2 family protein [Vicinamibacterales bacterium]